MDEQTKYSSEGFIEELSEARKIQLGMLPDSVPEIPGFQIAAHSSPAVAVSGDFYDFIQLGDGKLGVVIGDAVGHGIAASLLMTMTLTNFRSLAHRNISAADMLNGVNRRLVQSMKMPTFVTCIYFVLDTTSNSFTCATAGMQPWLIKAKSGKCQPVEVPGSQFPIGISQEVNYECCEVEIEPGDSLILYTDGIPEALNSEGEFYSFDRLEDFLIKNKDEEAEKILDLVLTDVKEFAGDHPQEDDITMVVLKSAERPKSAPTVSVSKPIVGREQAVTTLFAVADVNIPQNITEQIRELIHKYGGITDSMNDDTLVALFGMPVLHKDDVERAMATAQAIQGLQESPIFRIGISTGMATIRADADIDYRHVGENINSALQLANAAEPGQTLVAEDAHRYTHGAFHSGKRTAVKLPFDDETITAYKQEWMEFRSTIESIAKEAGQLAGSKGRPADWKNFGKRTEDRIVSQMADILGVKLKADQKKISKDQKAQSADAGVHEPDIDWKELGKKLESKAKLKAEKWLNEIERKIDNVRKKK